MAVKKPFQLFGIVGGEESSDLLISLPQRLANFLESNQSLMISSTEN